MEREIKVIIRYTGNEWRETKREMRVTMGDMSNEWREK